MISLYITSTEPYAGKTLTSLVLGTRWQQQGRRVGFFKPVGVLPVTVGNEVTDEDALFVGTQLGVKESPSHLCPVILGPNLCRADRADLKQKVKHAFEAGSAGRDVMLISGLGSVFSRGSTFELDALSVAEMLDTRVLVVAKPDSFLGLDGIIAAKKLLGERMVGAILNRVPARQQATIEKEVLPCLGRADIEVFGIMPEDPVLSSVSVREIAEATGWQMLAAADSTEELVENFIVGAMGVDSALRFFRQMRRKCVITGGDRSDIQFAALETSTRCLILTGALQPTHSVLARAEALGVPVLLVRDDTLTTVTRVEQLLGKQRVRQPKKIEHALSQFEEHLDLAKLDAAIGLN